MSTKIHRHRYDRSYIIVYLQSFKHVKVCPKTRPHAKFVSASEREQRATECAPVGKSEAALNALEGVLSSDLDGDGDVAIVGRLGNGDGEVQDSSHLVGQGKDRERAVNDLAMNMFESMTGVDLDNDGDVGIGA